MFGWLGLDYIVDDSNLEIVLLEHLCGLFAQLISCCNLEL